MTDEIERNSENKSTALLGSDILFVKKTKLNENE